MKNALILLFIIPLLSVAQFSSNTVKRIDEIQNNNSLDVTLNPINQVVIPYLNSGELVIDNGTGLSSLPNGLENQLLAIISGELTFIDPPASSPLTTKGDLYTFDTDNQRLPIGADSQILSANSATSTGLEWIDPPVTSPTTTEGDLIIRGATEDIRIPIGLNEYLLTSDGTTASWQPAPVSTTLDTKGQIQTYSTENAALDVGLDGTFLVADSTEPTGLKYTASLQGKLNPVTDWVEYTPTIQGFGAFNTLYSRWRRVGDSIEVSIRGNIGTRTAQEVQIGLPNSLLLDNSYSTVVEVGRLDVSINTEAHYSVLATGGDNFFNVGFRAAGGNGLFAPSSGSAILSDSAPIQIIAKAKIQGWTSGLDAAVQNIQLTAQTANEFKIKVEEGGTVIVDDFDIINGDCTLSSTNSEKKTCVFNTGIFTEEVHIVGTMCENNFRTSDENFAVTEMSSTGFAYFTQVANTGSGIDHGACFTISKTGADVNRSQVIAGTFVQDSFQDKYSETEITYGKWNGEQLYRRCFTVASDITTTTTIATWDASLKPKNANNYFGTVWAIDFTASSANQSIVTYDSSTGNVDVNISGAYKLGAGSSFCLDYLK